MYWMLIPCAVFVLAFLLKIYVIEYERSPGYWSKQYLYYVHWFFTAEKWGLQRTPPEVITSTFVGDVDWRLKEGVSLNYSLMKDIHDAFLAHINQYEKSNEYGHLLRICQAVEGIYNNYLLLTRIILQEKDPLRLYAAKKRIEIDLKHYQYLLVDSLNLRYNPGIPRHPADLMILPSRTACFSLRKA